MAKTNIDRFNQGLDGLLTLGGTDNEAIYKGYYGVLEWLDAQGNMDTAMETLGAKLALGGYVIHSEKAKKHRNAVRSYMLLMATRYAYSDSQLTDISTTHSSYNNAQSTQTVIDLLVEKSRPIVASTSGVVLTPKLLNVMNEKNLDITEFTKKIRQGRDDAKRIVERGLAALSTTPNSNLTGWFGQLTNSQLSTLKSNFKQLLTALTQKSIQLDAAVKTQTWGTATPRDYERMMQRDYIEINLGHYFYTKTGAHSKQLVRDPSFYDSVISTGINLSSDQRQMRSDLLHNLQQSSSDDETEAINTAYDVASKALKKKIKDNEARLQKDEHALISYAGVILHEVTHNVINTTDVSLSGVTMYGPNSCFWLAKRSPAHCITNADNYRLYCENYL
ncbi:M35 family metallo-endopeptidase [Vibrio sp.]|nr:M35 family metallo-endopeptidase [Vibrio sp.]